MDTAKFSFNITDDMINPNFSYDKQEHNEYVKYWEEKNEFIIDTFYLDLCYLKDIYLGTLLEISKDDKEIYKHIIENILIYDHRIQNEDIFKYFPNCDHLKSKYYERLNNKDIHGYLWSIAPHTIVLPGLEFLFKLSVKSSMIKQKRYKPIVYIGTYPFNVSLKFIQLLKLQFSYLFPQIDLRITHKPYNQLSKDILEECKLWFIHDPINFFKEDVSIYKDFFENLKYENKYVTTPRRVDMSLEQDVKIDDLLVNTQFLFSICCQFKYLNPYILTNADYKEYEESK